MKKFFTLLTAFWIVGCAPVEVDVMSFNMRYDNPEDSLDNWRYRKEAVARQVAGNGIDICGTQELLINQLEDLKALLPQYDAVGIAREDGIRKGEHSAIFFRRERFTPVDSGNFWLSETPDSVGSKGWDGACERIATWAVLREKGGRELFFINTHLDHVGVVARREGISLLLERIAALKGDRPVIATGDYNSTPDSDVVAHILQDGTLRSAHLAAAEVTGTPWTFFDFGRLPVQEREMIDYIFVGPEWQVSRFDVLPATEDGRPISDHAAIRAHLILER